MQRLGFVNLVAMLCGVVSASALVAQGRPGGVRPNCVCPPGPSPCSVTPSAGQDTVPANGVLDSVAYTVRNTGGTYTGTYALTKTCTGITCAPRNNPRPALLTLAPGSSGTAWVKYYHPSSPGSGSVALTAADTSGDSRSTGTWFVITTPSPGPPTVALHNFNGVDQDRSLCLTFGGGQAAGLSCGDLFVTHAMPAYRTMSRDRQLTLFYNSATAAPRPTVAAWVTQPQGQQAPTSVIARLLVNGVVRDSASFSTWGAGATRQIVLAWITDTVSGLYPFTLAVKNMYQSGPYETTLSDTLIVVNRAHSEFGAGWWLDGVEQLVLPPAGNRILWLGGDGSAAVYDPVGTTWVRAAGPFRDTLVYDSGTTTYTRTLRHGIQVTFDAAGHHLTTVNRAQNTTTFTWTGPSDTMRLTSIQVPPGVAGTTYSLAYNAANNLHSITDPAGRVLRDTVSSGNLTQIFDPDYVAAPVDSHTVHFAYDAAHRMTSRTGRRGFATTYSYTNGLRVTQVTVPLRPATHDSARTSLAWWDERGLAIGFPSGTQTPADTLTSYSRFDGPRTDVPDSARFWVDRWGAPLQVVGPVSDSTFLTRSASTGLVSRVRNPVGSLFGMTYDARGNLLTLDDSTHEGYDTSEVVTTRYTYSDSNTKDSPSSVSDQQTYVTNYAYNHVGLDSLVTTAWHHRTLYLYTTGAAAGLLASVTEDSVPTTNTWDSTTSARDQTTTLAYNTLGDLQRTISPMADTSRAGYNAYTQVVADTNAVGAVTQLFPSVMGPNDSVVAHGNGSEVRRTAYTYSADFQRLSLADPRNVVRYWSYDAAGRDTTETDDYGHTERRWYDAAGLLDSTLTRDTMKVRRKYDAGGRLTDLVYAAHDTVSLSLGDSVHNIYDAGGRLTTAKNRNSIIVRQYNREGTLRQEQDSALMGGAATYNVIRRYKYWQDDMRDSVWDYPANGGDTLKLSYPGYDWGPDRPTVIVIRYPTGSADTATYSWDPLSRRQQLVTPIHATMNWLYDADGLTRRIVSSHTCTGLCVGQDSAQTDLQYRAYDRMGRPRSIRQYVGASTTTDSFAYDPYGQMIFQRHQGMAKSYTYDLSGNILTEIDSLGIGLRYAMAPGHNLLWRDSSVSPGTIVERLHYNYSAAGERIQDNPYANVAMWRAEWYDALGRMTSFGRVGVYSGVIGSTTLPFDNMNYTTYDPSVFVDVCRYDALGRRIMACGSEPLIFEGDHVVGVTNALYNGGSRIIYGPSLDDPLVVYTHETWPTPDTLRQYFLTDGAGRMLSYTDRQGNDATGESHNVYNRRAIHAQVVAHLGFGASAGEIADLAYVSFFRNRYYDQRTGRWMQEDPIGPEGGTNLYAYVGNNPAAYTDPFGLCPWCVAVAILGEAAEGAVVGAVTGAAEQIALNGLNGRPVLEGVARTAATGAVVGAVTGAVGSAVRIARAVGLAKKATGWAEVGVESRAEGEAAGEIHVGRNRVDMPDRQTGAYRGVRNPETGAKYRPEPGQGHVNLQNDQGGNVHVRFPEP